MNLDFSIHRLCSLTLIYCSLINRLTLAAAFAAAFFMGDGFVAPSPAFLMFQAVLQEVSHTCIGNIFMHSG